jgi:hypothetical protein
MGLVVNDPTGENGDSWRWAHHDNQTGSVPYEYSNWFASEPDHVNYAQGLGPESIGTILEIAETNADPNDPSVVLCSNETAVVKRSPHYWADININVRLTGGQPGGAWDVPALCQIGRFPKMSCTDAQIIESNCHPWADCEFDAIDYFCECPENWTVFDDGFGPNGCQPPQEACDQVESEGLCPVEWTCGKVLDIMGSTKEMTYVSYTDYECCNGPLGDDSSSCRPPTCEENEGSACHVLADCDRADGIGMSKCVCPEGAYGNGYGEVQENSDSGCNTNSWAIQITIKKDDIQPEDLIIPTEGETSERRFLRSSWKLKQWYDDIRYDYRSKFARIYYDVPATEPLNGTVPDHFLTSMHHMVYLNPVDESEYYVTVNAFFRTKELADIAWNNMKNRLTEDDTELMGVKVSKRTLYNNHPVPNEQLIWGPRVYTWVLGTTSDELRVSPTGLEVTNVYFNTSCKDSGCWVFEVEYAIGDNNWNVFYVPDADNDDDLSYDFDYANTDLLKSFAPANFPCNSGVYTYDTGNPNPPPEITACCIPVFEEHYRPAQTFIGSTSSFCSNSQVTGWEVSGDPQTVTLDTMPGHHLIGNFKGMALSEVVHKEAVDPYVGRHKATFYMDEKELRTQASMLAGTVGVEYTVRTFVGMAEFKPTQTKVIDMFTKQVDIYLEKTNFFTVSTHGTNDYTFLDYVNLRLVEVLLQDQDNTDDAATDDFVRTADTEPAHYVQVTFTLGSQYQVKKNGLDLIPYDSVRAGKGAFSRDANMFHRCVQYLDDQTVPDLGGANKYQAFVDRLQGRVANPVLGTVAKPQKCAPAATMCVSPSDIPDSFVSYNIPLGVNWLPDPSSDLSENVFVSMVVQAENKDAIAGTVALSNITKTTLNAAIPVVQGGVNIFCDGVTAKTDLKDVANVEIIIGSAETVDELSRLKIIGRDNTLVSSVLDPRGSEKIDTDSIESALMTVVVLGDDEFFGLGAERRSGSEFGIEFEDAITIHIMEADTGFTVENSKAKKVLDLIESDGEELFDTENALQTDGYPLNGAFTIDIQRNLQRARLNPSEALLQECSFAPPRPTVVGSMPTTCVIRRDINGRNVYPTQNGRDWPTAMELPHCVDEDCTAVAQASTAPSNGGGVLSDRENFMASILGDSDYAKNLGVAYSEVIAAEYILNDRYKRAWWINPGYEWTPTQTNGAAIFQVSQKLLFFGLFQINESRGVVGGRRRVLLSPERRQGVVSQEEKDTQGLSQVTLEFDQTPTKLLSEAVGVPYENIKKVDVTVRLTQEQMCQSIDDLRETLRKTLSDIVTRGTRGDQVKAVTISKIVVSDATGGCGRRNLSRKLLATYSAAKADIELLIAFQVSANKASFNSCTLAKDNEFIIRADDGDECDDKQQPKTAILPSEDSEDGKDNTVAIAVGVSAGVVVLGAVVALVFVFSRRNRELPTQAVAAPLKAEPVGMWTDNAALAGMGPSTDGKLQAELAAAHLSRQNV